MKMKIILQTERLYQKLEKAIDTFKDLESKSLHDVDIELCIKDYISALLIFDQTLFESKII